VPIDARADSITCSHACSERYQNLLRSQRAAEARRSRPRPPCPVCNGIIDSGRRRNVIYCSEACKRIAVAAKYRERNPDAALARYKLEPGDYDRLLASQGGRCAICGRGEAGGRGGRFHVDHDHSSGAIRGLLCHACNLGIGLLGDDPAVMTAAIHYLTRARTDDQPS
jgi:hypothetical protein